MSPTQPPRSNKRALKTALQCIAGAWGYINSTLLNSTSGEHVASADWAYPVPEGVSIFTPNGYTSLLVTANHTTHPDMRPDGLDPSNPDSAPDSDWAQIGKYSTAGAGPYKLVNVTDADGDGEGPKGTATGEFYSATLPERITDFTLEFAFHDSCSVFEIHQQQGPELLRVGFYYRFPDQDVEGDDE